MRDVDDVCRREDLPLNVIGNRGASGIDGLLATAAGAAASGQPVVAFVGDLSALHDAGSLFLLHQMDAEVCVVVVNNAEGSIFRRLPIAGHDELLPGAVWQRGDILQINTPQRQAWPKQAAPESLISHTISVMPGPEFDQLSDTARQQLFGSEHIIDSRSNRMGLRLTRPIDAIAANKQLSSGVTPGTVQLTASGEPIILLADAQTIGGYPRVLQVMSTALDNLAQLKPGDSIELKLAE